MRASSILRIPCALLLLSLAGSGSFAAVTSLRIERETPGPDGEKFIFYSSDDGRFQSLPLFSGEPSEAVDLEFRKRLSPGWPQQFSWLLSFAAPPGEALAVGTYDNAVPYPRVAGLPRLRVSRSSGFGSGVILGPCPNTAGRFEVKQVAFDPDGTLSHFWATFEQTCGEVLRGEIRYNADVPIELQAPSHRTAREGHLLLFDVHGVDALGGPVPLTVAGLPPGASFSESPEGTGHFTWEPSAGQAGFAGWLAFTGESPGGDTDVVYTRLDAIPDFDDFDHPIPFTAAPFASTVYQEASAATNDPECPEVPEVPPLPPSTLEPGTVWYTLTPVESGGIQVAAQISTASELPFPSPGRGRVAIYTGERGALEPVVCGGYAQRFAAVAGTTYHIMVNVPPASEIWLSGDALPPPPVNDDLASATVVADLPFSDAIDTRGAMFQREPRHCIPPPPGTGAGVIGSAGPPTNVWYAYTALEDTRVTIGTAESNYGPMITAFSGSPDALQALGCSPIRFSFTALAGKTYHLMIGGSMSAFGDRLQVSVTGKPTLRIQAAIEDPALFHRRTGAAVIGGIVRCSRPAAMLVRGTLWQDHRRVRGDFEAVLACDGETHWQSVVTPVASLKRSKGFTGGAAEVEIHASGVPEDNPDDFAVDDHQSTLFLKMLKITN